MSGKPAARSAGRMLPPATYAIAFGTKKSPGFVRAVTITIGEDVVDMDEAVRIDLAEHPLYHHLQTNVKANVAGKRLDPVLRGKSV